MATEKRPIDANALMEAVRQEDERSGNKWTSYDLECLISTQPTADAIEVVHGQWVKYEDDRFNGYYADGRIRYRKVRTYYCDKCGYGTVVKSNYCSNCGAKMEGERNV